MSRDPEDSLGEFLVEGLRFVLTCIACPEQYEVFDGERQVGYVRLRHGWLRVDYPECGGEVLLENGENDDIGDGMFETDELRDAWLTRAAQAIRSRDRPS
jgi:hypothetical protein